MKLSDYRIKENIMWVAFYNQNIGDVLLLTQGDIPSEHLLVESHGDITLMIDKHLDEVIGINIFHISKDFELPSNGVQHLTQDQWQVIQNKLDQAGINLNIDGDSSEKFVVGYVSECQPHEDSDHLSITQVQISDSTHLQIVCGASNIAQGQFVIVAKEGAVMPSGTIIWDGELRGVESHGMICSTRELGLTHLSDEPGIWVLPDGFQAGTPLSEVVAVLSV